MPNKRRPSLQQPTPSARQAFSARDALASKEAHEHRPKVSEDHAVRQNSSKLFGVVEKYLKEAVYGGVDGIVTTFAVIAGVAGADLSTGVILIIGLLAHSSLGMANLIADGLSMAVGSFLSARSEQRFHAQERMREEWEVDSNPEK